MAEQADRLRVAQLERNKRRRRWLQWGGAARLSGQNVIEAACILPSVPVPEVR